jgi:hypothetical protein
MRTYFGSFAFRLYRSVILCALFVRSIAFAEGVAEPAAQALFESGRQLMLEHRYPEACEKLAESQRLEAAVGTQLNLAFCYEQLGKYASAYVEYHNALAISIRVNDSPRITLAQQRISALEPKLSRLIVSLNESATLPGAWVKLDGTTLGLSALNSPIPVDLGVHEVTAGADGKLVSRVSLDINAPGKTVTVAVPQLENAPSSPPPRITPTVSEQKAPLRVLSKETPYVVTPVAKPTPTKMATWIGAGAGIGVAVVAAAMGTYFGLDAFNQWSIRNRHCRNQECDAEAVNAKEKAETSARLSNYLFITSAVGAIAGVTLVVTATVKTENADRARPQTSSIPATMIYAQGTF